MEEYNEESALTELSGSGVADNGIMSEEEALSGLVETETVTLGQEEHQEENNEQEQEQPTEEQEPVSFEDGELNFLGDTEDYEQEEPEEQQQQEENNEYQEQELNINEDMNNEEVGAVKELFNKFDKLGLLDQYKLSDEDKQVLADSRRINDTFKEKERHEQETAVHEGKIKALNNFSESLAQSIPGYSTELVQNLVVSIHKSNPQLANNIYENPALLLDVWNKLGAKAQPQQKQTDVLSSQGNLQRTSNDLAKKVNDGTASEAEEAKYLASM